MPSPSGPIHNSYGKVSGPVVVVVLFSGAIFLFSIIFLVAYRQKLSDQGRIAQPMSAYIDSVVTPEAIRKWMTNMPADWIKVTKVEGQGFVVYVPCYSSNATLSFQVGADSLPQVICEYCDSSTQFNVGSIALARADSAWEFRLAPSEGKLRLLSVDDSLLTNYPEAPFRDKLLIWTRSQISGRVDSMVFVPKSQAGEFEVLHAEDENPEGCGDGASD